MSNKIVVIGGGAAGIAAARRLHDSGADVLLLEASGRLGGRAHTVRVAGEALDLGCSWLHSADRNPWSRIALAEGFQIDRTPSGWREQWHSLGFSQADQDAFHTAYAEWHERAEAFVQGADRPLSDFIAADHPWRPLVDAISGYANGANLSAVSLHDWAAYEAAAGDDNWRLPEGYGSLVTAYARQVPVRLDTPVSLVDHRGKRIRLMTPGGTIEADQVIVAVPTPIIADGDLRFDPPLEAKRSAAAALPLGLADKIFLGIRGDFPANAHLIGNPHSSCTASYQVGQLGRPVVEAFFGGDCAEALEHEDDGAAADFAIGELAGLLGNDWRLRLQPLARTRWRAEPFIRGSYSHARVGNAGQRAVLAQSHDDRLFFAGEACSRSDFSTAHGAYQTGIAAAEEALAAERRPRIVATVPLMATPLADEPAMPAKAAKPARPPKPARGWVRRLFGWLVKGVLAFLVLSVLWVVVLRFINPPVTFTMMGDLLSGTGVTKQWMSLDQMDPNMPRAAIAGEDGRFCTHNGFDFDALKQAYERNQQGGRVRGGSTISQQTAKNVFLIQGGGYVRKGFEAYFTFLIEHLWGKKRIMEVYLNVAETGIGTYGANAGSIRYFGHDASRMSPVEAGRIAAVLPLPKKRAAIDPRGFVRRHGNALSRYVNVVRNDGLDACLR